MSAPLAATVSPCFAADPKGLTAAISAISSVVKMSAGERVACPPFEALAAALRSSASAPFTRSLTLCAKISKKAASNSLQMQLKREESATESARHVFGIREEVEEERGREKSTHRMGAKLPFARARKFSSKVWDEAILPNWFTSSLAASAAGTHLVLFPPNQDTIAAMELML